MSEPGRGVAPPVAVVFATIGFIALGICGLGLLSLLLDAEVIATPGLGQLPGVVGFGLATVAVFVALWVVLHRARPSYTAALLVASAALLAYLLGMLAGAVLVGGDAARAVAAAGGFLTSWFAFVLAAAAFVAGWAGVALVRTRAGRPRWPWEGDDEP